MIFCLAIPVAVFFGVFFLLMHRLEKRLPDSSAIPLSYYVASLIVGVVCAFVVLVGIYLLAYLIPPDMSPVQAALDAQCGNGKYVADAKGYSTDPGEYWSGDKAFCENVVGQGWVCNC